MDTEDIKEHRAIGCISQSYAFMCVRDKMIQYMALSIAENFRLFQMVPDNKVSEVKTEKFNLNV